MTYEFKEGLSPEELQVWEKLFPSFKQSHGHEVILGPGDTLYLPPFWFHHVEGLHLPQYVLHMLVIKMVSL